MYGKMGSRISKVPGKRIAGSLGVSSSTKKTSKLLWSV